MFPINSESIENMVKNVKNSKASKSLDESVPMKRVRLETPKLLQRRKMPITVSFKDRKGTIQICLRMNGKCLIFSSMIKCAPGSFDSKTATIKGDTIGTVKLQKMRSDLLTAHAQLELAGIIPSCQLVRDKALKVVLHLAPNLKELLEQRIQVEKERYEAGHIRKNAYLRKINFTRHISNFFQWKYKTKAPLITDIKPADAQNLFHYLTTQVRLEQEFSMKIVQWLKTGLEFAVLSGWLDRNPFAMFKGRRVQKAIVYLSEKEIERIASLKFTDRVLTTVRDYFLFACYTGVNFKELQTLTRNKIEETIAGQQFIQKGRTKTGQIYTMYLYEEPREILARYAEHESIIRTDAFFPLLSHDKTNQALKVIQQIAGVEKPLTFGIARRSAATFLINKGVSPNAVSKMLGNSVRVLEKHYAVTSSETVIREISHALKQKAQ